jgi:O-glycosyl hydrolase
MAVRRSRPIFKVEQYRISDYFKEIAANPAVRVALVGDSDELRAAHEHIELLARSSGANVRAFGDEAKALAWLREALQSQEKR